MEQAPGSASRASKGNIQVDEARLEAALGHKQELVRGFGLFSLTSLGIIIAKYVCGLRSLPSSAYVSVSEVDDSNQCDKLITVLGRLLEELS